MSSTKRRTIVCLSDTDDDYSDTEAIPITRVEDNYFDNEDDCPQQHLPLSSLQPKIVLCQSTEDEITCMNLTKVHVCWTSPDGSTKACYNVRTLIELARTNNNKLREPPIFRSPMLPSTLEKIKNIHGSNIFQCLANNGNSSSSSSSPRQFGFGEYEEDSNDYSDFSRLLADWRVRCLENIKLFACPICYKLREKAITESLRAALNSTKSDEEIKKANIKCFDPMSVLKDDDDDEEENFPLARRFCFTSKERVKTHLKTLHKIENLQDFSMTTMLSSFG